MYRYQLMDTSGASLSTETCADPGYDFTRGEARTRTRTFNGD